jgi:hypothetical protein
VQKSPMRPVCGRRRDGLPGTSLRYRSNIHVGPIRPNSTSRSPSPDLQHFLRRCDLRDQDLSFRQRNISNIGSALICRGSSPLPRFAPSSPSPKWQKILPNGPNPLVSPNPTCTANVSPRSAQHCFSAQQKIIRPSDLSSRTNN